jgi:DNA replication and repair protein RecF
MQIHRAVKTKSKILKEKQVDEAALDVCDHMLASAGVAVNAARRDFLDRVELRASLCMHAIAPGDGALSLRLRSSFPSTEEAALQKLAEVRQREKLLKACVLGPQRDDVEILFGGNEARAYASQGQSRSLVLALKLSMVGLIEEHRHDSPLLILDDFDSELDSGRCKSLLDEVKKGGRQVFITGVSRRQEMLTEGLPIRCFEVSQGVVSLVDL